MGPMSAKSSVRAIPIFELPAGLITRSASGKSASQREIGHLLKRPSTAPHYVQRFYKSSHYRGELVPSAAGVANVMHLGSFPRVGFIIHQLELLVEECRQLLQQARR